MTDDTVAACRAALLRTCSWSMVHKGRGDLMMPVDDAAACMAEREAKLREALLEAAAQEIERVSREGKLTTGLLRDAEPGWVAVHVAVALAHRVRMLRVAALAAAQEGETDAR